MREPRLFLNNQKKIKRKRLCGDLLFKRLIIWNKMVCRSLWKVTSKFWEVLLILNLFKKIQLLNKMSSRNKCHSSKYKLLVKGSWLSNWLPPMNIPSLGNCVCKSMFKGLNALKLNWISTLIVCKGSSPNSTHSINKTKLLILINQEINITPRKENRIFDFSYNLQTNSKILKRCASMSLD